MRKLILSFMLSFLILSNINASSIELKYSDSVQKIKNYANNFVNNKKYILNENLPFIYDGETLNFDDDFNGSSGLLNIDEFIIARNYIYNGLNFWMVKREDGKYLSVDPYYDGYINDEITSENTSGVRPSLYIKNNTYVKGTGSRIEPWEFVEPFIVTIETSDENKGLLKSSKDSENVTSLTQTVYKGGIANVEVLPNLGYEFVKTSNNDDCLNKIKTSSIEEGVVFLYDINNDLNCKIYFDAIKYKLAINPNGGKWNGKTDISYENGTINELKQINAPTAPDGYTISFNANGGNNIASMQAKKEFVTWTLDGKGSITSDGFKFEDGDATITANYEDVSINLPTPSKDGYTFLGWYTNQTSGELVSSPYVPKSNVTLYARWIENKKGLIVDPSGGTWNGTTEITNLSDTSGKTVTINNPTPPKGYIVSFNSNGGNSVNSLTSSKIFDKWELTGGGTFSNGVYTFSTENGKLTANYKNGSITLPTPTRNNYKFLGWYTSLSSTSKLSTEYTPTKDIKLYAKWEQKKYTLTIDPNKGTWNGSTNKSTFTATAGSTKTISNPKKKGYTVTFNANGGSTSVNSKTSSKVFNKWELDGKGSLSGTTFTFRNGNATLTANYSNGSITLPKPTRKYYNFLGWYTKKSGGNQVGTTGSYKPTANITLYAHWKEKSLDGKFAEEYKCLNSTALGNIYIWNSTSKCDNYNTSGCSINYCNTLGELKKGKTICVVGKKSSSENYKSVVAWVKKSSIGSKGAAIASASTCEDLGANNAIIKEFGGEKFYKARVTAYCTNASCGGGWVLGTNAQSFFN